MAGPGDAEDGLMGWFFRWEFCSDIYIYIYIYKI